jgi:hypothetical protein
MAYDPQANRRRPKPEPAGPAPVDALLGGDAPAPATTAPVADDPPPTPAVTPAPADPPSDRLLLSSGLAAALGALAGLLTLRALWKRRRRAGDDDQPAASR